MKTKLKVIRYLENDVVATSGCYKDGMSSTSYEFSGDDGCGWWLNCSEIDPKGKQQGDSTFKYYNETGGTTDVAIGSVETLDGVFFHFDGNGNFEICTNSKHHCTYTPEPEQD